jgi:DNA-binding PadR family transcriptional regulator
MTSDVFGQLTHGHAEILVLGVLSRGPLHGYAIRKDISKRSHGLLSPSFGGLYPLLQRLEKKHLISGKNVKSATGRVVRQYRLTLAGVREVAARRDLWRRFYRASNAILGK